MYSIKLVSDRGNKVYVAIGGHCYPNSVLGRILALVWLFRRQELKPDDQRDHSDQRPSTFRLSLSLSHSELKKNRYRQRWNAVQHQLFMLLCSSALQVRTQGRSYRDIHLRVYSYSVIRNVPGTCSHWPITRHVYYLCPPLMAREDHTQPSAATYKTMYDKSCKPCHA